MKVRINLDTTVVDSLLEASTDYDGEVVQFDIEDAGVMAVPLYKAMALAAFKQALTIHRLPKD